MWTDGMEMAFYHDYDLYFTFFLLVSNLCTPVAAMFYDGG